MWPAIKTKWRICPILVPSPFHVIYLWRHSTILADTTTMPLNRRLGGKSVRYKEVNSLATSVCESMFIAIYTTQKIQLNMRETGAASGSIETWKKKGVKFYSCLRNKPWSTDTHCSLIGQKKWTSLSLTFLPKTILKLGFQAKEILLFLLSSGEVTQKLENRLKQCKIFFLNHWP